jgi:hypothetical protein
MAEKRTDRCPECGDRRVELVIAPGRFYCPTCSVAGPGPSNAQVPGQMSLDEAKVVH